MLHSSRLRLLPCRAPFALHVSYVPCYCINPPSTHIPISPPFSSSTLAPLVSPPLFNGSVNSAACLAAPVSLLLLIRRPWWTLSHLSLKVTDSRWPYFFPHSIFLSLFARLSFCLLPFFLPFSPHPHPTPAFSSVMTMRICSPAIHLSRW